MLDEHRFDAMVTDFYRAATGAIGWDAALAPVHEAFRTRATALHSVDLSTGRTTQLVHAGTLSAAGALDYIRHWHLVDPRRAKLVANPEVMLGRLWNCHEHFDETYVKSSHFHRQFLQGHEVRYLTATASMTTPHIVTALAMELAPSRGPLDDEDAYWLQRLARQLADALQAYERVRQMAAQAMAGSGLLDAFAYPMWLLDADRFAFHANAAARALTSEAVVADVLNGRLRLAAAAADRRLGECLFALQGEARHNQRWIIDARQHRADPPCWLHLHALSPARVLGTFGERPLMLATWFNPALMTEIDPFALGDLFGMTPTESRIAALLATGITAPEIAARLSCSTATVRTHLRHVLAKLGANRLADAVRLLRQGEALWAMPAG